jgi:hypothetical protein
VSLSYVPNKNSFPLRFHRTLKTTQLDLWEDAETGDQPVALASGLHGEAATRSGLSRIWSASPPLARAWWEEASTLDGVLAFALTQAHTERVDTPRHYPYPRLVAVLTLARLGRAAEIDEQFRALPDWLRPSELDAIRAAIQRAKACP